MIINQPPTLGNKTKLYVLISLKEGQISMFQEYGYRKENINILQGNKTQKEGTQSVSQPESEALNLRALTWNVPPHWLLIRQALRV